MAVQQDRAARPTAQTVGNAFVYQYYNALQQCPEMIYKFYQNNSKLTQPGFNVETEAATRMECINKKIMSLNYNDCMPLIKSVDAQESYNNGVLVLVTGVLIFKSGKTRCFSQSFFLAPQDNGFFVLNDIFKYLDEELQNPKENVILENGNVEAKAQASVSQTGETKQKANPDLINQPLVAKESIWEDVQLNSVQHKTVSTSAGKNGASADQFVTPTQREAPLSYNTSATPAKDAPKFSYASIVRKEEPSRSSPVQGAVRLRVIPSVECQNSNSSLQIVLPAASGANGAAIASEAQGNGYFIYVRNLPNNATASQVEEIFKKFGGVEPSAVQVSSKIFEDSMMDIDDDFSKESLMDIDKEVSEVSMMEIDEESQAIAEIPSMAMAFSHPQLRNHKKRARDCSTSCLDEPRQKIRKMHA